MPRKTFEEVLTRFREIPIPEDFDLLVAIANGGIIPAAPLNLRLNKEVRPLRINLRDECVRQPAFIPEIALYTAMNQFVGLIGIDDQFFPVGIDHEIRHSDILPGPSADPANIP